MSEKKYYSIKEEIFLELIASVEEDLSAVFESTI